MQQEPDTLHPLFGSMIRQSSSALPSWWAAWARTRRPNGSPGLRRRVPTLENGGAVFVGEGADKHLEVTYKIRDGWRWTDGTPVTPADAIFYWKLTMDPNMEVAAAQPGSRRSTTSWPWMIKTYQGACS